MRLEKSLVGDAERHVAGSDVPRGRFGVPALVVEEDVGAESLEERPLVESAEEQRLVDADIPSAQRAYDALVRRRAARSHQRRADRCVLGGILGLNSMQRCQEALEGAARQRLFRRADLARREGLQALPLVDALG